MIDLAQINGLAIAYAVTASGMLAGLLLLRADRRAYWRLPVYSTMVMVLGVMLWNGLLRKQIPAHAAIAHAQSYFYAALALYAVLGFACGCLLGRLTRAAGADR